MKKRLNIYIVRHGEKIDGENMPLTKRGRKQAELLAKRLRKLKISKMYSSDLERCKETAEIIKKHIKIPIKYDIALREVPNKVKKYPKRYKKEVNIIRKFWSKINKEKGNLLLVSSGIVNRILLSFALKIDTSKANFMQYPTGLTRIEKRKEKRYRIWHINDTSHLSDKMKIIQM